MELAPTMLVRHGLNPDVAILGGQALGGVGQVDGGTMPSEVESPMWATARHEVRSAMAGRTTGRAAARLGRGRREPVAGGAPWPAEGAGRVEPASDAAFVAAGAEDAPVRPAAGGDQHRGCGDGGQRGGTAARVAARLVLGAAELGRRAVGPGLLQSRPSAPRRTGSSM